MRQFFRKPSPFLIPAGLAAALLALAILFLTFQPSNGWGSQYSTANDRFQAESQRINQRFQDENITITRMSPADIQGVAHARSVMTDQFQADSNANNLHWQADIQRINHASQMTTGLLSSAYLLLILSAAMFAVNFYSSYRSRRYAGA